MKSSTERISDPNLRAHLSDGTLVGTWKLDPKRSTVQLLNRSMGGLIRAKGTFTQLSGDGVIAPNGDVTGRLILEAASIDTKNKKRDDHLRSADFFNVDASPHLEFTVEQLNWSREELALKGALQIRDVVRPLEVPITITMPGDGVVQLECDIVIDRAEFGIDWNRMGVVSMKNTITARAVFTRIDHP